MNFEQYQAMASRTSQPEWPHRDRLSNACMGLAGESGEFVDLMKKHLFHGRDLDIQEAKKELGDVLWYVSEAATLLGLSLDDIAKQNIVKLTKRYPYGFSPEASQARVDVEGQ